MRNAHDEPIGLCVAAATVYDETASWCPDGPPFGPVSAGSYVLVTPSRRIDGPLLRYTLRSAAWRLVELRFEALCAPVPPMPDISFADIDEEDELALVHL